MKTTAQRIEEIAAELARIQAAGVDMPAAGSVDIGGLMIKWNMPAGAPQDPAGVAAHTIRPKIMQALAAYSQELAYMLADLRRRATHENN